MKREEAKSSNLLSDNTTNCKKAVLNVTNAHSAMIILVTTASTEVSGGSKASISQVPAKEVRKEDAAAATMDVAAGGRAGGGSHARPTPCKCGEVISKPPTTELLTRDKGGTGC